MALTGDWWFGALVGKTVMALAAPLTALGLFAAGQRLVSTITGCRGGAHVHFDPLDRTRPLDARTDRRDVRLLSVGNDLRRRAVVAG